MADNRKYYYLKLKEDFFDTDEMKILESMKDGYLYSNILLKLYLKSLSNSGRLMYRNVIPYTPEILAKVKKSKYSLDQVIILASMVESEAATTEDRKTVAGVFLNRLHHPDKFPKLESCVTVEYAKGIKKDIISLADTKYNSKYNTYKYPGLPYGPICCPSMESINAVLTPTNNSYYYFQSDSKGRLHFARTWQEHAKIQKKLQSNWKTTKTRKVK